MQTDRITADHESKAAFQYKGVIRQALEPFDCYGQGVYIQPVVEIATEAALLFRKRMNHAALLGLPEETRELIEGILASEGLEGLLGEDVPITIEHANGRLVERYGG